MTVEPGSLRFVSLDDAMFFYEVEKRFGFDFAREDLARLDQDATLSDIAELIEQKLDAKHDVRQACLSMATFHKLRQGFIGAGHRGRLGPGAELKSILPAKRLVEHWRVLSIGSALDLPNLVWPPVVFEAYLTAWAAALLILAFGPREPLALVLFVLMLITLPMVSAAAGIVPRRLPAHLVTLRDLTEHTLALNYSSLSREYGAVHPDDIWNSLASIARSCSCGPTDQVISRRTYLYR